MAELGGFISKIVSSFLTIVIVICSAGLDADGQITIKNFCSSINKAGHTVKQAADAVKNVLDRFLPDDVAAEVITGDSGEGGAVQHLHPKLVELDVMNKEIKKANCQLHALQKFIKNPSKKSMGDQGMGCRY